MMTTSEVAKMFGVTIATVQDWINSGDLPGHKISNKYWRVWRSDAIAHAERKYA